MLNTYGHGNCARIPSLNNYEEAKAHYEGVKPIRGRNPEVRPLGKERRFTWYEIKRNTYANQSENREYYTYVCHLYQSDCVEFYPNGDITLRTEGWNSITTKAFIGYVMYGLGRIISESGKWYFVNKANQSFLFKRELQLKRDENGNMVAKNQVQEYRQRINRKAMNALRKTYKSFTDYGRTMLAMSNEIKITDIESMLDGKLGFSGKNVISYYNWQNEKTRDNRAKFFALLDKQAESGDIELLYDLASYVARGAGQYRYRAEAYVCEPQWFIERFDEMIRHEFRDQVFTAEPVPMGERFSDRNKKYFI